MIVKARRSSTSSEVAWWAVLATVLLAIGVLFFYRNEAGELPYRAIFGRIIDGRSQSQPWHQMAILQTGAVVVASVILSLGLGLVIALMQLTNSVVLRFLGRYYIELIRGIPIYVMLLFVYFGVRMLLKDAVPLTAFQCAFLALGASYAAYMAEVIRAGIQAIPPEEIEAASLEGNRVQVLFHVVLPQALRLILPALANECIALTKDSALVGAVTILDITRSAQLYATTTFQYFETFSALALIYLLLSLILSRAQRSLEAVV